MPHRHVSVSPFFDRFSGAVGFGLVFLLCAFFLSGCGKKPSQVDSPEGVDSSAFFYVYPDPATDPRPDGAAERLR